MGILNSFIHKANVKHNYFYDYSLVEYKKSKIKVKIICPIHGVFEQTPNNHLSGNGCPKCKGKNKTTEEFISEAKRVHGDLYDYSLVEYKNSEIKIHIGCQKHGFFEQLPKSHLSGNGCPKCKGKNKTTEEFISEAKRVHGDLYDYSLVEYEKNNKKIKIICPIHGLFEQTPSNHLMGKCCYKCNGNFSNNEIFIKKSKNVHNEFYDYSLVDYKKKNEKIKIICPIHGIFEQTPDNHLQGNGCYKCNPAFLEDSILEILNDKNWLYEKHVIEQKHVKEIAEQIGVSDVTIRKYFNKFDIENIFKKQSLEEKNTISFISLFCNEKILNNCRDIIPPYELDILIPEKNIAIEYCGLYWHSNLFKNERYHENKLNLCQEKGIRLITIFEDEWIHRQEQVKSKLKSILKADDREKIYARKCNVVHLSKAQKSLFFEQNHIQGNGPGSISYGLEYNGEIVAAITFIDQKRGKFTLNRYAASKQIPGGFSKLLEYFKRNHEWSKIITFADLRWSEGELYEKCGFKLDKILKPDYSYIEGNFRVHKFNYRHKNLKNRLKNYDPNLSEKENCLNNKILKIWDCGKKKYITLANT